VFTYLAACFPVYHSAASVKRPAGLNFVIGDGTQLPQDRGRDGASAARCWLAQL